jgi:hypothetical protein
MGRGRTLLVITMALTALAFTILARPAVAVAVSPGTGSWYWPTGTEDFRGWDGYWVYRPGNRSWHMAQDMPAPMGHPVYAIGDGVVLESDPEAHYGGVLVVLHKTADGHDFKAVYGHIRRGNFPKGAKVRAGQVIGTVNSCRHVHFGIHPGRAYPPDKNPLRGHTYVKSNTYGWVDPLRYLRDNPRVLKYAAPALPTVATLDAESTPTVLGTAAGAVYWSVETSAVTVLFSRGIAGGDTEILAEGSELPVLDAQRFATETSGTSFALRDRLPVLTTALTDPTPAWGRATTLSGSLRNSAGSPFVGATVALESSIDSGAWTQVGTALTGTKGAWTLSYRPIRACRLRVRFSARDTYLEATGTEATVTPHAGLGIPCAPSVARSGRVFTIAGSLTPRHASGTRSVVLRFQRSVAGRWIDGSTHLTTNSDSGSASRYRDNVSLPAGKWRVRAEMAADPLHAATSTGWLTIAVRSR